MTNKSAFWHSHTSDFALKKLETEPAHGLSLDEAQIRLERFGENILKGVKRRSPTQMFLNQFNDFMIQVLIGAAIVAGFLGEPEDTIAIATIILLNAILGFVQEFRAEKAMAALQSLAAPSAKVIRSGNHTIVTARLVVPGDIVILEAGDIIPADLRLIGTTQLKIDESALTGESHPVEKDSLAVTAPDAPLGDRTNMAYKGTLIAYGRGLGVVTATGMETEFGRIATLLHGEDDSKTPLQKRLARFGQRLAVAVIALSTVIFVVGIIRGEKLLLMFLTSLSLAVAAIPEALPAVVTVSLALGASRMAKHKALIRRLPAVETLGSVTVICSDKTGTLTQNKMQVDTHLLSKETRLTFLFQAMALNNDAKTTHDGALRGDPTETALFEAAEQAGFIKTELEKDYPRVGEIPFSSERGQMTTLHGTGDGNILVITKGGPERILSNCKFEWKDGEVIPIDLHAGLAKSMAMAKDGLRVLAFASKSLDRDPSEFSSPATESDFTLIGFVGLIDPPRPLVKEAIEICQSAAIRVVMITGDHPATALAIARKLRIVNDSDLDQGEHGPVLTGKELSEISDAEFQSRVENIRVYARVSPEQKIKIVEAFQAQGEIVAMTGDGINDAPALKKAEIGIAMGKIGTDVAREASDMVLLDDNFATIVGAVREGRRIFDNIRKFLKFALTGNSAEILTLFLAPFFGLPIPFLPIHILWINLVTDGLPGLALATEPEETNVMQRPPRHPNESVFAHGLWQHTIWVGLLMAAINIAVMAWAYRSGNAHWQSMVFTVITLSQLGHVLAVRSERDSLFTQGLSSNISLLATVIFTCGLQLATLYAPFFNKFFKTQPLSVNELLICLMASSIVFLAVELEKLARRRGWSYG